MRKRLAGALVILCLLGLAMPSATFAQRREDDRDYGRIVKRGKNGVRVGDHGINIGDGPGIINYERRHRWMSGPGGAATVIGVGAGAGALTGGVISGSKKGAVVGALVGAGAATGIWLYKNRTTKRRIF
ncbi:MAG TPA: hypothetical protein VNO70_26520 [Blastocatellia bacterium]|nr:hypothetical protein [Blastocatellia bacterium]